MTNGINLSLIKLCIVIVQLGLAAIVGFVKPTNVVIITIIQILSFVIVTMV